MLSLFYALESWFLDLPSYGTLFRRALATALIGAVLTAAAGLASAAGLLPEIVFTAAYGFVMFGIPLWGGLATQKIRRSRVGSRR